MKHDFTWGVNVENAAHPCVGSPCAHGGSCRPRKEGYECDCPLGFEGLHCQKGTLCVCVCVHARMLGNCFLEQREWTKWETATLKEPVDYPETSILFIFISDVNSILGDSLPAEPQGKPR